MSARFLAVACIAWQVTTGSVLALETLSLQEAWRAGLDCDISVKQAEAALTRARIGIEQAKGERLQYGGDLNIGNRYGVSGLLGSSAINALNTPLANATVMARWPIFTGGKVEQGITQAETLSMMQAVRVAQSRETVLYNVAEAYWNLKRAHLRLDSQHRTRRDADSQLRLVQSRLKTGRAEAFELSQAEMSVLTAEDDLSQREADYHASRLRLGRLLGQDVGDISLDDPLQTLLDPGDTLQSCIDQALANHPELRHGRLQIEHCGLQLALAKAEKMPQIDLISAYQHGNNPFIATVSNRDVLSAFTGVWDARLNLSLRAFDHGVIDRQIALRENELQAERTAADLSATRIRLDVRRAWEAWIRARDRVAITRRSENVAMRYQQQIETRYQLGYGLAHLVEEARNRAAVAHNRVIDAQIEAELARVSLLASQGRLGAAWAKLAGEAS